MTLLDLCQFGCCFCGKFFKFHNLTFHQLICPKKTIPCIVSECTSQVSDMVLHLVNEHSQFLHFVTESKLLKNCLLVKGLFPALSVYDFEFHRFTPLTEALYLESDSTHNLAPITMFERFPLPTVGFHLKSSLRLDCDKQPFMRIQAKTTTFPSMNRIVSLKIYTREEETRKLIGQKDMCPSVFGYESLEDENHYFEFPIPKSVKEEKAELDFELILHEFGNLESCFTQLDKCDKCD